MVDRARGLAKQKVVGVGVGKGPGKVEVGGWRGGGGVKLHGVEDVTMVMEQFPIWRKCPEGDHTEEAVEDVL